MWRNKGVSMKNKLRIPAVFALLGLVLPTVGLSRDALLSGDMAAASASEIQKADLRARPVLKTLENRLAKAKASGETQDPEYKRGKIPVLVALRESAAGLNKFSDPLEKLGEAQKTQSAFIAAAKEKTGGKLHFREVSAAVGSVLAVEARYGDLKKIASLPQVARISPNLKLNTQPQIVSRAAQKAQNEFGSVRSAGGAGYSPADSAGRGELISVIDTGFDIDHGDFAMNDTLGAKYPTKESLEEKIKQIRAAYPNRLKGKWLNAKFPYGFNFAGNNTDVKETGDSHGTHVAAIAAAGKNRPGKAPAAQLLAMRVLAGEYDKPSPERYLAAIEESVLLGATSINLSFGIPAASMKNVGEEILHAIEIAKQHGVLVTASAGNENYTDADLIPPKTEQPNYGTISAPALTPDVLAVASLDNNVIRLPYLTYGGEKIPYYMGAGQDYSSLYGKTLELADVGAATEKEMEKFTQQDLRGKAVLIRRGQTRFDQKVAAVAAKKAAVALIFDNEDSQEWVNMGIHDPAIPAVFLRRSEGLKLKRLGKVAFVSGQADFVLKNGGKLSHFSSWGPTPEFDLKPEITAVGGHVQAAQPGNRHGDKSGTSMASPQVAGVAALLSERLRNDPDLKFSPHGSVELSAGSRMAFLKNMLMSTAVPVSDTPADPYVSPRKQGAGVLNRQNALSGFALAKAGATQGNTGSAGGAAKINLGAVGSKFDLKFTVENISRTKDLKFTVSQVTVQTDRTDPKNPNLIVPLGSSRIIPDLSENDTITVPAGKSVEKTVSVDISKEDPELQKKFRNGYFVEGFIRLHSLSAGQSDIGLPYIGFRHTNPDGTPGAFTDLPAVERSIYDFADLSAKSTDVPKYMRLKEAAGKNAFTALMSRDPQGERVLGEMLPGTEGERRFAKTRIAISPNGDNVLDYAQFRGVFLSMYYHDYIEVADESGRVVYKSAPGYDGAKQADGTVRTGRKSLAAAADGSAGTLFSELSNYRWDGKDSSGRIVPEGKYTFRFKVRPVAESAKEQEFSFPVTVDSTPPAVKSFTEKDGLLTLLTADTGAGVARAVLETVGSDGNVHYAPQNPDRDGALKLRIAEKDYPQTYLRLTDYAGNTMYRSLEAITHPDAGGSVKAVFTDSYGDPADITPQQYELTVRNEQGVKQLDCAHLPLGRYKAELKLKVLNYAAEKKETEFTVSRENPNVSLTFKLRNVSVSPARIPVTVTTSNGGWPSVERPTLRFTNEDGITVDVQGSQELGSHGAEPMFKPRLTPGKWKAEVVKTDPKWAVILPKSGEITVKQFGDTDLGGEKIWFVGPDLHRIDPVISLPPGGEIKISDVHVEAVRKIQDSTGKNALQGMQMPRLDLLPAGVYELKVRVPQGYYAVADIREADLRKGNAAPKITVRKKTKDDFAGISVRDLVNGKETVNLGVPYEIVDEQGKPAADMKHLDYGTWTVRIKAGRDGAPALPKNYYTDNTEQKAVTGPNRKSVQVTFAWKPFAADADTAAVGVFADWGFGFRDMMNFGNLSAKPYKFIFRRLDKAAADLVFDSPAAQWGQRMEFKVPYGRYAVLPQMPAGYKAEPCTLIRVDSPRAKVNIKYSAGTMPSQIKIPAPDPAPKPVSVRPAAPVFDDKDTDKALGTYTIPAVKGVQYRVNGVFTSPGTYRVTEAGQVEVEAVQEFGAEISADAAKSWKFTFTKEPAPLPEPPAPVPTPPAPRPTPVPPVPAPPAPAPSPVPDVPEGEHPAPEHRTEQNPGRAVYPAEHRGSNVGAAAHHAPDKYRLRGYLARTGTRSAALSVLTVFALVFGAGLSVPAAVRRAGERKEK